MKYATLFATLALAYALVCAAEPASQPASKPASAAAFTLNDSAGKAVSLSDFAGKIVVLEWTNPECPFVNRAYRAGTPIALCNKYKDKGVAWLAINSTAAATPERNQRWSDDQKLPYPILDDHAGQVGHAYDARSTPSIVIIDAHGNIAYRGPFDNNIRGDNPNAPNYVDQALTELLAGKAPSIATSTPYGCTVKYAK